MPTVKRKYLNLFAFLSGGALAFAACTLDEEPAVPSSANNEISPAFLSTEIIAVAHDSLRAKARLSSLGNLAILHHGWVWSENPGPTLADSKLESGALGVNDSFEMLIPGLILGNTYHFRPYVVTGSGETYGPEKTILMDIPKLGDVALVADSACFLRVQGSVQSLAPPIEYGIVYLAGAGTPTLQQKSGQVQGAGLNNGNFQTDLTMLTPNTAYSIRAYARSASGTGYSRVLPITTPASALVAANFSLDSVDAILFQGADVHFINSSIGATAYAWSFGDGAASAEVSPRHTFDTKGNMTVRLTAESGGCILTKDTMLTIIDDPFKDYWVEVEGGTFMMGCTAEQGPDCYPDEYPAHLVTLSSFFIGKTEVTQGQWQAVTANNPSFFYTCGPDCPIENISWDRVVYEFIPALNRKTGRKHRLPTEAEWEFAARGGNKSKGNKYAGGDDLDSVAWYSSNSVRTHSVAKKWANELGLFDMSGNVREWCNDWYEENYFASSPSTNPPGPVAGLYRVSRGSGWADSSVDARVATRIGSSSFVQYFGQGFRIALH